jgi:hypothetical protein
MCAKSTAASSAWRPTGSPASRKQDQQIYSDEGIVGQGAAGSPDSPGQRAGDYFKVSSGLGGLASVLVVPTSDDDRVNGVIELGFLRPLKTATSSCWS